MRALRIVCFCVCVCFAAAAVYAGDDIWDKASASWSRKDAERILNNSPWGRSIATKEEYVKSADKSSGRGARDNSNPFERGDLREGDVATVWWWSARTPRRAFLRVYELSGGKVSKESAEQFAETKATAYLVSVMGGGSMVATAGRLEEEQLKKAAWLHSPRLDRKIECEAVEVVMVGGKPDRILFKFPTEVEGKPVISDEDSRVLFRFKLPKSPKESIDEAKQFEASFEPKKMQANGEPDY